MALAAYHSTTPFASGEVACLRNTPTGDSGSHTWTTSKCTARVSGISNQRLATSSASMSPSASFELGYFS